MGVDSYVHDLSGKRSLTRYHGKPAHSLLGMRPLAVSLTPAPGMSGRAEAFVQQMARGLRRVDTLAFVPALLKRLSRRIHHGQIFVAEFNRITVVLVYPTGIIAVSFEFGLREGPCGTTSRQKRRYDRQNAKYQSFHLSIPPFPSLPTERITPILPPCVSPLSRPAASANDQGPDRGDWSPLPRRSK